MRKLGFLLAAVLAACSGSGSSDGGTDAGADAGHTGNNQKIIEISGTVQYHPVEVAWAEANGKTLPSLDNATFNVEDAITAQAMGPPLKTITLAPSTDQKTWTFDVTGVNVTYTTLALVGSVEANANTPASADGDTIVFSGYGLGIPPFPAVYPNNQIFVVSLDFVKLLASSIQGYNADGGAAQLISDGFVLAQATDDTGTCGAGGVALYEVYGQGSTAQTMLIDSDTYYFNDTLTAVNTLDAGVTGGVADITSSSGLFVRVMAGSAATYTCMTPGATYLDPSSKQFQTHLNGSRAGTALMVFFKAQFADGGTEGGGLDSIGLTEADGGLIVQECASLFPPDAGPDDDDGG